MVPVFSVDIFQALSTILAETIWLQTCALYMLYVFESPVIQFQIYAFVGNQEIPQEALVIHIVHVLHS
jgi:hypothetical protein